MGTHGRAFSTNGPSRFAVTAKMFRRPGVLLIGSFVVCRSAEWCHIDEALKTFALGQFGVSIVQMMVACLI